MSGYLQIDSLVIKYITRKSNNGYVYIDCINLTIGQILNTTILYIVGYLHSVFLRNTPIVFLFTFYRSLSDWGHKSTLLKQCNRRIQLLQQSSSLLLVGHPNTQSVLLTVVSVAKCCLTIMHVYDALRQCDQERNSSHVLIWLLLTSTVTIYRLS